MATTKKFEPGYQTAAQKAAWIARVLAARKAYTPRQLARYKAHQAHGNLARRLLGGTRDTWTPEQRRTFKEEARAIDAQFFDYKGAHDWHGIEVGRPVVVAPTTWGPSSEVVDPTKITERTISVRCAAQQSSFRRQLEAVYGKACMVSDIPFYQACHLTPAKVGGSHWQNGLLLNHVAHYALDRGWWGIDPATMNIHARHYSLQEMCIEIDTLKNLSPKPHYENLLRHWDWFTKLCPALEERRE